MSKYFGTNGVRGRFNELTPELALKIARATGTYFNKGKMLVARDCRLTGEVLKNSVIAGLASVGCNVIDLGIISSPTAELMVKKLGAAGCIIITASHNPPEWNALKVVDGKGVSLSWERGEEIEKFLDDTGDSSFLNSISKQEKTNRANWDTIGSIVTYPNATSEHTHTILKLINLDKLTKRKQRLKIVLDCGNGTACVIAPLLFEQLGVETILLNATLDGTFPGRSSEPTEANVSELIAKVNETKADAGIAWDADGDRVIFVDETGEYVIGDKVFALCVLWKLSIPGVSGDVVTTVATSKAVEDTVKSIDPKYKTNYTKIGAPYLSEEMMILGKKAVMGGEEVGGVIWPELSLAKDGFMTGAKMIEAICEKPLSEWLKQVPVYHNVKSKLKTSSTEQKTKMVERVRVHAQKKKLNSIDIDGVRINFEDSWVIVRPSGTEEYVRVFAEAKTKKKAEDLVEEYTKIAKG
ncbi:phosphoglucosamine mutase [Candidatus Micrarchaeota archaeon]|nr:phosphoglucosamine mutase [Candidatus Micrarchaeota archaeon]